LRQGGSLRNSSRPQGFRTLVSFLPRSVSASGRGDAFQRLRVEILLATIRALIDGNILDGQPIVEFDG